MLHSCYINNWQGQAFNVRRNRNLIWRKMLCLRIRIPYNFTFICSNFFLCVRKCVTMHGVWKTVNTSYEIIPSAIPYHSTTWDPVSYLKFRSHCFWKADGDRFINLKSDTMDNSEKKNIPLLLLTIGRTGLKMNLSLLLHDTIVARGSRVHFICKN